MRFYPVMAEWKEVPADLLTQDIPGLDAIVDGRGYVAFSRRPDLLYGVVEEVSA
jgi:hypothetical protein